MDMNSLLDELYSYSMHGIKLGLENIKVLCESLGNPQNDYKIVHIAGTNGKGSTASTLSTILLEAGYKVGKYTSPHILKFNERIRFGNNDISDENIVKYYEILKNVIKKTGIKPTFFEVTTAMMFKYFSDMKADYVVLETGMGGRFDATNIADADICIITNVSFDHMEYLGDTIYKIAKEKVGIIKKCENVIIADNNSEFLKAIYEVCKDPINVLEKYKKSTSTLNFEDFTTEITIDNNRYKFSLFGNYQVKNFLCAYEAAKLLSIDENIIKQAANKVVWQCRFEKINDNPLVVLDGAHNIDGMKELVQIVKQKYLPTEVVAIASILKDKEVKAMLKLLKSTANNIILTSLEENQRGLSGNELLTYTDDKDGFLVENDILKAFDLAKKMSKKLIIVCGSFYTLSKFKEAIYEKKI